MANDGQKTWTTPKRGPIDVSYQLRNLFEAVITPITGQTRGYEALTTNLDKAQQAKEALERALVDVLGESTVNHFGINVALKEGKLDSFTAYSPDDKPIFLSTSNRIGAEQATASTKQDLDAKLDAYFATDWEAVTRERQKYAAYSNGGEAANTDPNKLKPAFARADLVIKQHKGVSYTVELKVPREIRESYSCYRSGQRYKVEHLTQAAPRVNPQSFQYIDEAIQNWVARTSEGVDSSSKARQ